jgi:hypothetical protein
MEFFFTADHTEGDPDDRREDDRRHGEFDRRREARADLGRHGRLAVVGGPEVASQGAAHVREVLRDDGLIETVGLPPRGDRLLGRVLTEDARCGVG